MAFVLVTGDTDTGADAPDAYTNAPDALPDTSGASEMYQSSDDTPVPENTHSHTRTVNGALLHGPGTYAVTDAVALASSDGLDRDDDTDGDAVVDTDTLSDADGLAESDSDAVTDTDCDGTREALGAALGDPHADGDGDADALLLLDAAPEALAYVGEGDSEVTCVEDSRCVPNTE